MPATYEPIATTTLGSAASSITFSSIPATYTDIRIILSAIGAAAGCYPAIQFNGDTGTNYSYTLLRGNGSAAASIQASNSARGFILNSSADIPTTFPALSTTDIFSYAGSTFKTLLSSGSDDKNGSGEFNAYVNLWRSTSAINRIDLIGHGANFATGTTATLYGIKNA
jgi:hypothetical protein